MPIPTEVQTQTGKTRTYNITLWRYRVTIVVTEKQKHVVCIVELRIIANNTNIFSAAQK